jgi:hypothetical protein
MKTTLLFLIITAISTNSCKKDDINCIQDTSYQSEELIFQSGYEGGTQGFPSDAHEDIIGIDNTFSDKNDWVNSFSSHSNFGDFRIWYEEGKASERFAKIIDDPTSSGNHVLQFKINEPHIRYDLVKQKGRIQASILNNKNLRSIYIKQKIYLHPDFEHFKSYPDKITWMTLQEFWNNAAGKEFPFRVTFNLRKTEKGQGELYFGAHGQKKKKGKWEDLWSQVNKTFSVPTGEWLTIETYIVEGNADSGRFKVIVTDQAGIVTTVIDQTAYTYHPDDPCPDGFNRFNPMKLYTSDDLINFMTDADKTLQIYWDDFEIWANKNP